MFYLTVSYDVDIEALACILSSLYAMLLFKTLEPVEENSK